MVGLVVREGERDRERRKEREDRMGKERNGCEEQSVERKVQEEVRVRVEEEQGESS